jgi:hypothetical protein
MGAFLSARIPVKSARDIRATVEKISRFGGNFIEEGDDGHLFNTGAVAVSPNLENLGFTTYALRYSIAEAEKLSFGVQRIVFPTCGASIQPLSVLKNGT